MIALERAHTRLRDAAARLEGIGQPAVDLRPAASALQPVFGALYDAFDGRADRLASARGAMGAVGEVLAMARQAEEREPALQGLSLDLERAREHIAEAERWLIELGAAAPKTQSDPSATPASPELLASDGEPRLHAVERPSLVPALRVAPPPPEPPAPPLPPLPRPTSASELSAMRQELRRRSEVRRLASAEKKAARAAANAEPKSPGSAPAPPGFVPGVATPLDEPTFLRERARDCLEEITMVGLQRAPLLGEPWRNALVLERRMLAAVDAIAALGPIAIASLEPLVLDAPAKDPPRVFAIAMALGSIAGRDALAAAERVLFSVEREDPEALRQFAAALKLAPHDLAPLVLRTLLADPDPERRAAAASVLAHRALATPDELFALATDLSAPKAVAIALPELALLGHPRLEEAIDAAVVSPSPLVREAGLLAMALSGHPAAASSIERELSGPLGGSAALLYALVGDSFDATRLFDAAMSRPSPALLEALGWAGAISSVPPLIELLELAEDDVRVAAASALERITGAGLVEEVELAIDRIAAPDAPEPDVGEPKPVRLARMVSDPRDLPADPAPELGLRPASRAAVWRAYWREHGGSFEMTARYRRGQPYTPLVSLRELDALPCTPAERRTLVRELIIRTGSRVRLDPHDFVKAQESALSAWHPIAARASASPGHWIRPDRRR